MHIRGSEGSDRKSSLFLRFICDPGRERADLRNGIDLIHPNVVVQNLLF
jgi:hypothetical protein